MKQSFPIYLHYLLALDLLSIVTPILSSSQIIFIHFYNKLLVLEAFGLIPTLQTRQYLSFLLRRTVFKST